jgi:hypothetical protein
MKTKKTTYQKLKEERIKLLNDIRIMVMNPNSISEVEVRTKYRLRFQVESAMFYGEATSRNAISKGDGIEEYITNK